MKNKRDALQKGIPFCFKKITLAVLPFGDVQSNFSIVQITAVKRNGLDVAVLFRVIAKVSRCVEIIHTKVRH